MDLLINRIKQQKSLEKKSLRKNLELRSEPLSPLTRGRCEAELNYLSGKIQLNFN